MTEVLISFAVEKVLAKAVSLVREEVSLARGFKEELEKLCISLPMIQRVLLDAEKKQEERVVGKWLKKVKEVACDAEDLLDELTYETLRREVELQKQNTKKVRDFFSPNNPIKFQFKMAHKIKNINKLLEKIKQDANIYGLVRSEDKTTPAFNLHRATVALVGQSEVIRGRENDVSEMVKMMINSSNNEVLSVIPIVGMAGLGKTTLAKLVYNNEEMASHFDARIWVCVSDNFDATRILSECLESLYEAKCSMNNTNAILENLQKRLVGKRYLLVLDDVWNEDSEKWKHLKRLLLLIKTRNGSSIIVTTRSDRVASAMEALPMDHLKRLSEDECWSIFKDRAFTSGSAPMTLDLEAIGKEIGKKCAGVPLAAKEAIGQLEGGGKCKDAEVQIDLRL